MTNYPIRPEEPTKKDYQENAYQKEDNAWIDDHGMDEKNGQYLIFSNTIFYPNGGGQKGDRGIIIIPSTIAKSAGINNEIPIIDTRKDGEYIRHYIGIEIDEDILEEYIIGEKFKISIDWDFRFTQMRLHSTAHLLHCFIVKVIGKDIGFPSYSELFEDKAVNRYPFPNALTREQLDEVVKLQNAWTTESHPIKTYKSADPNDPDWFRWWECSEYKIPCGGVHPKDTNEIGEFTATMKLKKNTTSITFRLEN